MKNSKLKLVALKSFLKKNKKNVSSEKNRSHSEEMEAKQSKMIGKPSDKQDAVKVGNQPTSKAGGQPSGISFKKGNLGKSGVSFKKGASSDSGIAYKKGDLGGSGIGASMKSSDYVSHVKSKMSMKKNYKK